MMMNGHMMPPWSSPWGWVFMLIMLIFWVLVIIALVYGIRRLAGGKRPEGDGGGKVALEILKERYARGEITREEFQQMKQDLE